MAPFQPISLQVRPSTDDQRKYLDTFHLECGASMECCIHFITERGIDLLADLVHATFEDGIAFGITRTCRTPMAMIYEVLCDDNFFGSEEALFRFIPKPGKGVSTCKYHFVGLLRVLGFRAVCHQRTRGSTIDGTDCLFLEKQPANSGCLSVAINDEGNLYEFYCHDRDRGGKDGKPLGSDRPKAKPKAPKAPKKSKKITDEASIKALMEQVRVLTEERDMAESTLRTNDFVLCDCGKWYAGWDGECDMCSQSVPPPTSPLDVLINDEPIPESSDDEEWEASSEDDEAEVRGVPLKYMDGRWRVQNNDGSFHPMGKKDIDMFNTGSGLKVLMKHPMYSS